MSSSERAPERASERAPARAPERRVRPGAASGAGPVHRGAVLAPEALAAFGVDAPWRPLELAGFDAPVADTGIGADGFAPFHLADAVAPLPSPTGIGMPTLAPSVVPDRGYAARAAGPDEGAFAAALPDLTAWGADAGPGVAGDAFAAAFEEQAAAREQELRDELEQAFAERAAAEAARHDEELAQAYEAGRAAGQAEGEAAAEEAVAGALAALHAACTQVAAQEERWLAHLQENVAALAVAVARHVIAREVTVDDALVIARVADALAEFPSDQPLSVRVNPSDLALVKRALDGDAARQLRWTADDRVGRGGCLVEGRERIVDGRVDAALERVYRQLSGHYA